MKCKVYILYLIEFFPGTSKPTSSKFPILPSVNLTPNQMKTRAYEFAAIFENAFDQLNIIYNTLSTNDFHRNNNQFRLDNISSNNPDSDCNPFALNLAGIFT